MPDAGQDGTEADAFWAFSLDLYARPGVAAACLRLQDERGLDVNLLLLCCWWAQSGRGRLSEAALAGAEARVAPWRRDILEKLRAVRRALKSSPGPASASLYADIKAIELRAEREEQRRIFACRLASNGLPGGVDGDLAANLGLYLARHGQPVDAAAELISAVGSIR